MRSYMSQCDRGLRWRPVFGIPPNNIPVFQTTHSVTVPNVAQVLTVLRFSTDGDAMETVGIQTLFSSRQAVSVLCASIQQSMRTRFDMSRDLLVYLVLVTQLAEQAGLRVSATERIRCEFINKATLLVQVYNLLKCFSELAAVSIPASLV